MVALGNLALAVLHNRARFLEMVTVVLRERQLIIPTERMT